MIFLTLQTVGSIRSKTVKVMKTGHSTVDDDDHLHLLLQEFW